MTNKHKYSTLSEVKADLKIYQLERKIALEQLKSVKGSVTEEASANKLWQFLFKRPALVMGAFKLLRRIV
ncbi:MAG: hypothetical protein ACK5NB_11290 [Flavobacteriaceae bacterium]